MKPARAIGTPGAAFHRVLGTVRRIEMNLSGSCTIDSTFVGPSNDPRANATVTSSNGMMSTTDADGHFMLDDVTVGTYNVTITKNGYQTITRR